MLPRRNRNPNLSSLEFHWTRPKLLLLKVKIQVLNLKQKILQVRLQQLAVITRRERLMRVIQRIPLYQHLLPLLRISTFPSTGRVTVPTTRRRMLPLAEDEDHRLARTDAVAPLLTGAGHPWYGQDHERGADSPAHLGDVHQDVHVHGTGTGLHLGTLGPREGVLLHRSIHVGRHPVHSGQEMTVVFTDHRLEISDHLDGDKEGIGLTLPG